MNKLWKTFDGQDAVLGNPDRIKPVSGDTDRLRGSVDVGGAIPPIIGLRGNISGLTIYREKIG